VASGSEYKPMNCRYASAVTLKLTLAKYAAAGPAASGVSRRT